LSRYFQAQSFLASYFYHFVDSFRIYRVPYIHTHTPPSTDFTLVSNFAVEVAIICHIADSISLPLNNATSFLYSSVTQYNAKTLLRDLGATVDAVFASLNNQRTLYNNTSVETQCYQALLAST